MTQEAALDSRGKPNTAEQRMAGFRYFLRRLFKRPVAKIGAALVLIVIFCAIFAPWISPYDPIRMSLKDFLKFPSSQFLLGADTLGRDILSRVIYGSRISLEVGVIAVGIGSVAGTILGLVAGYFGKWLDSVIMRIMDGIYAFPALVLALGISAALGPGIKNVMIAIGVTMVPSFARLVRGQTLAVKETYYVMAVRSIGASNARIMFRHIWPNVTAPVIVYASLFVGYAILAEAGLSFLGVGTQPPAPAWGSMLKVGYGYLDTNPLFAVAPGVAIMLTVLGFNFLGDGLRDALDPRLRSTL